MVTIKKMRKAMENQIDQAVSWMCEAKRVAAFTGAGISVESGISPFRGPDGIYSRYDPKLLGIRYFNRNPEHAWTIFKEIFFSAFGEAKPNHAHLGLARLEKEGKLSCVVTQNIDNLHQEAGSQNVIEFHGNSRRLVCRKCGIKTDFSEAIFENLPPRCDRCRTILKPDFVFFGEPIPLEASQQAVEETTQADLWLVIGTTGEVYPANAIPVAASEYGARIIEINPRPSAFTHTITDLFLQGRAGEVMATLIQEMYPEG
jgi:NAD-dependent deacetylase